MLEISQHMQFVGQSHIASDRVDVFHGPEISRNAAECVAVLDVIQTVDVVYLPIEIFELLAIVGISEITDADIGEIGVDFAVRARGGVLEKQVDASVGGLQRANCLVDIGHILRQVLIRLFDHVLQLVGEFVRICLVCSKQIHPYLQALLQLIAPILKFL